jgi:carboxypeptidase T
MMRSIASSILLVLLIAVTAQAGVGDKMLVRIHTDPSELPRGLDVAGFKRFEWADAVVDGKGYADLVARGLRVEILEEDFEGQMGMIAGVYHPLQDVMDSLAAIATNHPDIARLDTLPFTTDQGRVILALKISDNVDVEEDEPELIFTGLHHAREWPTVNIILFAADTLVSAYGVDFHTTEIVDSRQIWLVPCENPDGYFYCHDQSHDWRKNRRYFPAYNSRGVDLNRNYDGTFDGSPLGEWGSPLGQTSRHPTTEVYDGPEPNSEAETKAMVYLNDQHDFVFSIDYHTWAEAVMWPWGYSEYVHVPDDAIISDIGQEIASRITQQDGSGTYDAFQSAGPGMYPTTGGSDDWRYGYTYYHKGSNILSYVIEACQSFHPNQAVLDQVMRENFDGIMYLCEIADSVKSVLVPYVLPPIITLDSISSPDFDIVWTQKNPAANAELYELEELIGFTPVIDSAENGTDLWDMGGFTRSTARVHSGTYSFFSTLNSAVDDTAVAMTTKYPLPVMPNDSLTLWYYCNIEVDYDFAYFEVSRDGLEWKILDYLTGTKGWDRVAYSLEDYVGGSIFIRLRYAKDEMDPGSFEGLYVDEVSPVATFDSTAVLSSAISDTFYSFTGKDPGDYWYRLKGYNTTRGWGHYSELVHTQVPTGVSERLDRRGEARIGLFENRPNPFRSSTTIAFTLPASNDPAALRIFDQSGRAVRTIIADPASAARSLGTASYSLVWDGKDNSGKDTPSGVYFYTVPSLKAGSFRKMILVR